MATEKKASKRKGVDSTVTDSKKTKRAKLENSANSDQKTKNSKAGALRVEDTAPLQRKITRARAADFYEEEVPKENITSEKVPVPTKPGKSSKLSGITKEKDEVVTVTKSKNPAASKRVQNDQPKEATEQSADGEAEMAVEPKAIVTSNEKEGKQIKRNGKQLESTNGEDNDFGGFSSDEDGPLNEAETAALLAGFESTDDSSEEEGLSLDRIPAAPKPSKAAQKELTMARKETGNAGNVPGVLYIGRIPHGFYEQQMRSYFSQFGNITKLRLARNRKTGAPKHYAFVEFESSAVADIVARTMDKYLLFGHILQVRHLPPEQVHENIWKGANKRFKKIPWGAIEGRGLKAKREREVWQKRVENEQTRRNKKAKVLTEFGYEFSMPALKKVKDLPSKRDRSRLEKGDTIQENGAADDSKAPKEIQDGTEVGDADPKATGQKLSKLALQDSDVTPKTAKVKKSKGSKVRKRAISA